MCQWGRFRLTHFGGGMNYFIEGIQGAGKSTLVSRMAEKLPEYRVFREGDYNPVELAWCTYMNEEQYGETLKKYPLLADEIRAKTMVERDADTEEKHYVLTYTRVITDVSGFHKEMEQYEIYNGRIEKDEFEKIILSRFAKWKGQKQIFECSLFQNIVENQILFYEMPEEEILEFYRRLAEVICDRDFRILYLDAENEAENLDIIRKERVDAEGNEMWFPLMMGFLEESPYGKRHGLKGFDDLVAHLKHRRTLEKRILKEVFPENAVLIMSKAYEMEQILRDTGAGFD